MAGQCLKDTSKFIDLVWPLVQKSACHTFAIKTRSSIRDQ